MNRLIYVLLTLTTIPLLSQDYEVKVTEVTVWIKATDGSGKAVPGLTQDTFEVYEDGKKMTATCFEEAVYSTPVSSTPASSTPAQTKPITSPKRVVLILDLYNMHQAEYLFLKPKIVEFVKEVSSYWEIMLVGAIPGAVEANVPFTSDAKVLQAKLDQISANAVRDIDALNKRRNIMQLLSTRSPEARQRAYRLANEYALEEKQMARESLKALQKFEKDLVQFKEDSHLVVLYISGGINENPGRQYYELIEGDVAEGDVKSRGLLTMPSLRESGTDLWAMLRKIVAQLNGHNITFYTIHTRGFVIPDTGLPREKVWRDKSYLSDTQDILAQIAEQTGGIYFENSLNFRRGFDLILNDLDHQYLICYKAPVHANSGEFHKIKVKTKRSGLSLRHRSGYID